MSEPVWAPPSGVVVIHDRQIARHGGAPGMRDRALLEAALARPQNLFAYGEPTLCELAAAYAFGIAKAHAFVDGNKRTAFVTAAAFLRRNGLAFEAAQAEVVRMMEGLAEGTVSEAAFAAWLERGTRPVEKG